MPRVSVFTPTVDPPRKMLYLNDLYGSILSQTMPDWEWVLMTDRPEDYDALRAVQESRVPFTIFTGKRTYTNMLFSSLRVDTTPDTENALMLVAHCREIIIVSVQVTPIPQNSVQSNNGGGTGPASSTGNVLAAGSQSLQSAFGTVNANGVSNALGVPV